MALVESGRWVFDHAISQNIDFDSDPDFDLDHSNDLYVIAL
ncbi:hypothetical protein [Desulfosarcina ovata]|nr:hypothetical protein [Desulfosarcina ovata]